MERLSSGLTIESVRGGIGAQRREQLLAFWAEHTDLSEEEASRRLAEVACLLIGPDGEIEGVNSAVAARLPTVGGRPFWVYRSRVLPSAAEARDKLFNAAFDVLEDEFDGSGPIGLCMLVADPDEIARNPDVLWPQTKLMYVGYLNRRQVRIRYFHDAVIAPGTPDSPSVDEMASRDHGLEGRYRIEPLADSDTVDSEDLLELWVRERAMPAELARRRLREVLMVATDESGNPVGVTTVYLHRSPQLDLDMWYLRAFVAGAHRQSGLAAHLVRRARELLEERFVSGSDPRGQGLLMEVENEALKRNLTPALWPLSDTVFIGENERGDHLRVHYFSGAQAPARRP